MNDPIALAVLFPLAIGIVVWVLFLFDWAGRRRDRRKRAGPT